MGKSKELSFDLKENVIDLNKSGKSLGQSFQSFTYIFHGTDLSPPQSENTNYHLLLREESGQDGQESTKNHQKTSLH